MIFVVACTKSDDPDKDKKEKTTTTTTIAVTTPSIASKPLATTTTEVANGEVTTPEDITTTVGEAHNPTTATMKVTVVTAKATAPTKVSDTAAPKVINYNAPNTIGEIFGVCGEQVHIFDTNNSNYGIQKASYRGNTNKVGITYDSKYVNVSCTSADDFYVDITWHNSELNKSLTTTVHVSFK